MQIVSKYDNTKSIQYEFFAHVQKSFQAVLCETLTGEEPADVPPSPRCLASPSTYQIPWHQQALKMTLNPQFQQIGETFVKQYYLIFDGEREGREKLVNFYHVSLTRDALISGC